MEFPHWPPQWSAEGNFITFSHSHGVYTVQSDGSSVRLLAGGSPEDDFHDAAHSPSMSPNGSTLAYAAYEHDGWWPWSEDYRWEVVTSAIDGSDRRRLTKKDNISILNLNPSWSHDGKRVAFLSNRTNLDSSDAEEPPSSMSIYTMAPNGSDVRRVTEASIVAKGTAPVWFPNGRTLAFVAVETDPVSGSYQDILYTARVDDGRLIRLAETSSQPEWSPDGMRIAFIKGDELSNAVYSVNVDGSDLVEVFRFSSSDASQLKNHTTSFRGLSWSPDGSRLLLSGYRLVGSIGANGSDFQVLANMSGSAGNLHASWSKDGSRIAVYAEGTAASIDNGFDIVLFTMNPDGSDKRVLVRDRRNVDATTSDLYAVQGGSWDPSMEWPPTTPPAPSASSTNGAQSARTSISEPVSLRKTLLLALTGL